MRRRATHADSWYTGDSKSHSQLRAEHALSKALRVRHIAQELNTELEKYLQAVQASEEFTPPVKGCKAIIAPYVLSHRLSASELISKPLLDIDMQGTRIPDQLQRGRIRASIRPACMRLLDLGVDRRTLTSPAVRGYSSSDPRITSTSTAVLCQNAKPTRRH